MEQQLTIPLLKQLHAEGYTMLVSEPCAGGGETCTLTPQKWDVEEFITGDLAKKPEDFELLIIEDALLDCAARDLDRFKVAL
ncbi:hypothetical protein ACFOET_20220 [Parapedobacter deserti]|uniref:Uncharacterized protein n=1 Tax=Parapedobacter deserti TaxID=1912957 RepID=A0ABV7JS55_9SPHI